MPRGLVFKLGGWMDPPIPVVLRWTRTRMTGLEHHPKTRMGPIPAGVSAPQCGCHAKERASNLLLGITIRDSWHSPQTFLHVDPVRVPSCSNSWNCRTNLQRGLETSTQWDNTPRSPIQEPGDLLQPAHSQPTYMGGARPKVPNKPSADQPQSRSQSRHREEPDHVNYPHRCIVAEMSQLGVHHPLVEGDQG